MKASGKNLNKILYIILALSLVYLFFTQYIGSFLKVTGISMQPTIDDGDIVYIDKTTKSYNQFDVIVFYTHTQNRPMFIKRIAAKEGQRVYIDNGDVFVDGEKIEKYFANTFDKTDNLGYYDYGVVPQGCFFVLGDNPLHSVDSRSPEIGYVEYADICGKAVAVIFPPKGLSAVN